ncbi:MAG: PIN domain-containing protein [Bacillota bacterium]|nr:PIN domain-containing protein [Bacillota bacterium]
MKYILDKNVLTHDVTENIDKRDDLCITQDVLEEAGFNDQEIIKIKKAGVHVLNVSKKHLQKLVEVMANHGNNLKLINLYPGKGTADVVMIAYVLSEQENPETLFTEQYTIVTNDKELTSVATKCGIECVTQIPL